MQLIAWLRRLLSQYICYRVQMRGIDADTTCRPARHLGTVIDGVYRDVNRTLTDEYQLLPAGLRMRTGKDRMQVVGVNEASSVGKIRVSLRDIVVADVNGAAVVPRHRAREVTSLASKIEETESGIRELVAGEITIAEVRKNLRYDTLHRKE